MKDYRFKMVTKEEYENKNNVVLSHITLICDGGVPQKSKLDDFIKELEILTEKYGWERVDIDVEN